MNDRKIINTHYLSLCYKSLIGKEIIHFLLFLIEITLIFLQIIEIYYNDYIPFNANNNYIFSPLTNLALEIDKLPKILKIILYPIIIIIIIINSYILNSYKLKINVLIKIMVNISEILFYRIISLAIFNYLFIFKDLYLIINILFTIPYVFILIFTFSNNHLFLFFPNLIKYPYDSFSKIIDLQLLLIKIFISISRMGSNRNISKSSFALSIFFFFILLFYLSYKMIYKSYYLMNNTNLNNIRFSILLSICISLIVVLLIDKNKLFHVYFVICLVNIILICLILVSYFYDPYKFANFDKDDNIENIYYYFFMLDRDKNKYFLIEEKIEEHISKCNMCNLCKKYNIIKNNKEKGHIDLYKVIYNGKNRLLNLMNIIIRRIKKNGKNSFINNSYYLINIIFTYSKSIKKNNYNILLNIDLIFEVINYENKQYLEENKIALGRIKYTNDFFLKAKKVIQDIYDIFEEKRLDNMIRIYFKLGEEIEKLNYNEIKSNFNNNLGNSNYNNANLEGLPNCNNLLSICSLFYEELFNETISNSGISIRDNPNLLEDLINNNMKYSKHITFEINFLSFSVKIIRAGGEINKYENKNFFDLFLKICKNNQIFEMKKVLLNSNNSSEKSKKNKKKEQKFLKGIEKEKQHINFNFLIEEKENNEIFCRLLKLKLSLLLLTHINTKIYLNGIYALNTDIIVSEETKKEELLLFFGNKKQIKIYNAKYHNPNNSNNNKIVIKRNKNEKYLGTERLLKSSSFSLGSKNYNVYHFLVSKKNSIYKLLNSNNNLIKLNKIEEEQINFLDRANNNTLLFNDLASHASSGNNSMGRNTLISYNRDNKKIQQNENEAKELKIIKYILLLVIALFLSIIIMLSFLLNEAYNKTETSTNFFLSFSDFSNIFHNLFFSSLSLGCIGWNKKSGNCTNFFSNLSEIFKNYDFIENSNLSSLIDFSKFLFYQNQILIENLNININSLMKNLTKFNNNIIFKSLNKKITHFKINQNYANGKIDLKLNTESITFSDLNLLIISRFSTLSNDFDNIHHPVYILNKTGEDVFNNIFLKDKLSSYQENFYLNILDFKNYAINLNSFLNDIEKIAKNAKVNIRNLIYIFMNFILFFVIIIFIILILLIFIYLYLIIKTLFKINNELKEKINKDTTVKQQMIKKIDNLKLLLNFYDYDINKIINKLNKIYDEYRDNYNLKLKQELKILKREGKKEIEKENKDSNCLKSLSIMKKYKLYKYAVRKKFYLTIIFITIIVTISLYFINNFLWIITFQKDSKIMEWKTINDNVIKTTNKLITNYLIMIYDNQTLEEISLNYETKDFISYIFNELTPIYSLGKYNKYLNDNNLSIIEDNENCYDFYNNLNNDIFKELRVKFAEEEDKFVNTMILLCEYSQILKSNNYKTIYLQFFSYVQKGMESFSNIEYSDIIKFINQKVIIEIDLIYMTVHKYIMDIIIQQNKKYILLMMNQIWFYLILTNVIVYPLILILIIITFFVHVRNMNNDIKKFVHIRKIFKVCNLN